MKSFIYICFGLADSESLVSAGGDHLEGLIPDCNGILICEIVHFHTWGLLICRVTGGRIHVCIFWRPCHHWHLLRVMNVRHRDYVPLPCTWMQKKRLFTVSRGGRGLHWHCPQLSRATCGRNCEVVHKKIMNFCDVSTHLKITLFIWDVVLFTSEKIGHKMRKLIRPLLL